VQDEVELLLSDVPVRRIASGEEGLARDDRHGEAVDGRPSSRQGPQATHVAEMTTCSEAVPVLPLRLEAVDLDVQAVG